MRLHRTLASRQAGHRKRKVVQMMSSVEAAAVLIGLAGAAGTAQVLFRQSESPDRQPIIRTDATLVLVPVTVTDERGTPVPSLTASDFVLREDKKVRR